MVLLLTELRLENLRRFEQLQLQIEPGWNVFVGSNGAGKTTILEAAYMLSHGHSFRSGGRVGVQRDGSSGYSVFGRFDDVGGQTLRAGLARVDGKLIARVDSEAVPVSDLVRSCAVVCFEPGSHELIAGAAEVRRQFLDWGVFHVEHAFLHTWRRYQRALRQRNALLRANSPDSEFEPWEVELSNAGELLASLREQYIVQLRTYVEHFAKQLLPELGTPSLELADGWDRQTSLLDELAQHRARDRERGHTTRGPHRSDWSLRFQHAPRREHLSRGQEKLVALTSLLAQCRLHAELRGHWPLFCFDDLSSELDAVHQQAVVDVLQGAGAQVLVTGTEIPASLRDPALNALMFHVEHGVVDRLI